MKNISRKKPFRRSLAIICAATIALLQCAVLFTVDTVHGADQVEISVKYKDGRTANGMASGLENSTERRISYTYVDPEDGVEKNGNAMICGTTISQMLSKARINASDIETIAIDSVGPISSGDFSTVMLLDHIDESQPHPGLDNSQIEDRISSRNDENIDVLIPSSGALTIDSNKKAIDSVVITNAPSSIKVGDKPYQLKATVNGDSFFKENSKDIKFKWKIDPPSSNATITDSGLLTPKKDGNVQVAVQFDNVTGKKTITIAKKDTPKKDISKNNKNIKVSVSDAELKNGKAYPKVIVKDGAKELVIKRDYNIIEYENNNKVGTAKVIIKGMGDYQGTRTETFTVTTTKKQENIIDNSKVRIRVKSGEKLQRGDSSADVRKKLKVKVNNITTDKYKLIDYDIGSEKTSITIQIDGYDNKINDTIYNSSRSPSNYTRSSSFRSNYRVTRPSNTTASGTTGTTVPNVTYAPDRTITVKEVYLGQKVEDEPQTDPMDGYTEEPTDNTDYSETMDPEELKLDFGPAAGSAAVAVAAAGAGAVGRIRRFRLDTATEAVQQVTNSEE